jgi:hypothetical protein
MHILQGSRRLSHSNAPRQKSLIPKGGNRLSDKIMRKQKDEARGRFGGLACAPGRSSLFQSAAIA